MNNLFKDFRQDLPAGLVVFLVALPLCLGISLASGAPLFSGIIAGIIGGIAVASVSGSPLSVSGPAAGLTTIVITAISDLGFDIFLLSVVIAGFLQILLGVLKAGIMSYYFPSGVIKGMLAAIGLTLIFKQIPHALGYDKDNEGDFSFFQVDGANTFSEILNALNSLHPGAVASAIISLGILILWERPYFKQYSFFKLIPGALMVVVFGVLTNLLYGKFVPEIALEKDHLVMLPTASGINEFMGLFTLPDFSAILNYKVWTTAVTIALVASIESLLSIEAVDKLDPYKRNTPTNLELKAQGIGNVLSGLIGGLPLTAVIVRSSANVNAGAKTRLSAIFHGILLLLSVIALPKILNLIPLSCLAAILLVTGYKLAKISLFKSMYKLGWEQFIPFLSTILAILFSDLLKGILVGLVVSVFFILRNNYSRVYNIFRKKGENGEPILVLELTEDLSFINKGSVLLSLDKIPENAKVIIDGSKNHFIDLDIVEILNDFKNTARLKNIDLTLIKIPEFKGNTTH